MERIEFEKQQKLKFAEYIRSFDIASQEQAVHDPKMFPEPQTPNRMTLEVLHNAFFGLYVAEPPKATTVHFSLVPLDRNHSRESELQRRAYDVFFSRMLRILAADEQVKESLDVYNKANIDSPPTSVQLRDGAVLTQTVYRYKETDEVRNRINGLYPDNPLPPNGHPYAVRYDFEPTLSDPELT